MRAAEIYWEAARRGPRQAISKQVTITRHTNEWKAWKLRQLIHTKEGQNQIYEELQTKIKIMTQYTPYQPIKNHLERGPPLSEELRNQSQEGSTKDEAWWDGTR